MKWIKFILILFLLPGLPLFQMDQVIDINWLICENSLTIKSEWLDPELKFGNLWFDSEPIPSLFNQMRLNSRSKDSFFLLFAFFKGTSHFNRPPPSFHPFTI
jgi:hypothetical protein